MNQEQEELLRKKIIKIRELEQFRGYMIRNCPMSIPEVDKAIQTIYEIINTLKRELKDKAICILVENLLDSIKPE